jgi:two-component SAPR family response regulator
MRKEKSDKLILYSLCGQAAKRAVEIRARTGMDDYVTKPFGKVKIEKAIIRTIKVKKITSATSNPTPLQPPLGVTTTSKFKVNRN